MILFPSAAVTHENIPIQTGETRFSITGYTAGGLWRYADQGMQRRKAWEAEDPGAVKKHMAGGSQRWADACAMFMTMEELRSHWEGERQGSRRRATPGGSRNRQVSQPIRR